MTIGGFRFIVFCTAMVMLPMAPAGAEVVYRWVDDEGRPHLSDQPPPADARQAEQLPTPAFTEPAVRADEDPYSILNQLKRLEDSRRQTERERMLRRQLEREYELRRRALDARRDDEAGDDGVRGFVVPFFHRPPHHRPPPGHHPGPPTLWPPDHPAFRPPMRPRPPRPHPRPGGGRVDPGR